MPSIPQVLACLLAAIAMFTWAGANLMVVLGNPQNEEQRLLLFRREAVLYLMVIANAALAIFFLLLAAD